MALLHKFKVLIALCVGGAVGAAVVLGALYWALETNKLGRYKFTEGVKREQSSASQVELSGVSTGLYPVAFDRIETSGPNRRKGALAAWGDTVIVAHQSGTFEVINDGVSRPLALPALYDVEALAARAPNIPALRYLGLQDLQVAPAGDMIEVFASFLDYSEQAACFSVFVTSMLIDPVALVDTDVEIEGQWSQIYATEPCVPYALNPGISGSGGGFDIADDGDIILFIGDYGRGSRGPWPELDQGDIGRVIKINRATGERQVLSQGHRNGSGIVQASDGRIWAVEHGPRGGDELNEIGGGQDYGWPRVSLGSDYNDFTWRSEAPAGRHSGYAEPVYAWVPSIAPSSVVEVTSSGLERWKGDLLVASLRDASLHRIRLAEDRVQYVEPIRIGERLRDVAINESGEIYLLLDDGKGVLKISADDSDYSDAPDSLALCSACHQVSPDQTGNFRAPTLVGVFQRPVASVAGYDYSDVLSNLGGTWTRPQLAKYLNNTEAFGLGSTMPNSNLGGSALAEALDALIELGPYSP